MLYQNYEYFLQIVAKKSISKAAESLFISQPSLTKYLQRLEAAVGAQLIDRSKTPLRLTYSGQLFYEYVMKLAEEERDLLTKLSEARDADRGTVTIGMPLWRANIILPEFLPAFSRRHPLIEVKLIEGSAAVLEGAIARDEIDFGLMNLPVNYANVNYTSITEEHILMVGCRDNAFVQKYILTAPKLGPHYYANIHDFAHLPFIFTQPGQHITGFVNSMLSKNNLELNCVFRTSNVATAVNMAIADMGFTFVPELGTRCRFFPADKLGLFFVNNPPLHCTFAAVYKKNKYLSRVASCFISELKEFANARIDTLSINSLSAPEAALPIYDALTASSLPETMTQI